MSDSEKTDGQAASDIMGGIVDELRGLRGEVRDLKEQVNDFRSRGEGSIDVEHVNHVMQKHFAHDLPDGRPLPGSKSTEGSG